MALKNPAEWFDCSHQTILLHLKIVFWIANCQHSAKPKEKLRTWGGNRRSAFDYIYWAWLGYAYYMTVKSSTTNKKNSVQKNGRDLVGC